MTGEFMRTGRWLFMAGAFMLLAACSQAVPAAVQGTPSPSPSPTFAITASPAQSTTPTASPSPSPIDTRLINRAPSEPPPALDRTIANVSLEDIHFDTFNGGSIPLSRATDEQINRLRDRIKPVYQPRYDSVNGGDWLDDDDMVIGYVSESGLAAAYPIRMLNFHEFVNDVIGGVPVLISYCPLCASGVVYDRRLDDDILLFGNTSALYESDAVMFDHNTGSYWFQVIGEAIVGPLTGKRLTPLPSSMTTWAQWKARHPDTVILSRDLGLLPESAYDRDPFIGYYERVNAGQFAFPVDEDRLDDRLRPADRVFTVQVGDAHKAYPLTGQRDQVINDQVGGESVVVLLRENGSTGSAYLRNVDDQTLTFSLSDGVLVDSETSSQWNDNGEAVSGQLAGSRLAPVPSRTSFWFSIVGSLPGVELYVPQG